MSKKQHIVICDQDCIVGDMLTYALQKLNYKITRLKGSATQLVEQLLKQKADLLIANSGPDLNNQLHMLRCCRTKFPEQKQILITAAWENLEEMLKGEKIEAVLFKPFKLSQLKDTIEHLLPKEKTINERAGLKRWLFYIFSALKRKNIFKEVKQKLKKIWRCWLLKSIENERLQVFRSAYKFCQSKFASHKHILELWLYLEFLERRYLLAKCGADVERGALQFYYTRLKGKLERGLDGRVVSLKGGDGLGPELDLAQFSKFCSRLKNKELSFGFFLQAAQARLVQWALSRPSLSNIQKTCKKASALLPKTSFRPALSEKRRVAEAKAELDILALAPANECELKEVFQQVWC